MAQPLVQPGYGPTLPELVAGWPRPARIAARAAGALLVCAIAGWVLFGRGDDLTRVIEHDPVDFNLGYRAPLERVTPRAGEIVRLQAPGQELVVRPLALPAYRGDVSAFLPLYASSVGARLERDRPGLLTREEGRININKVVGYEVQYQARGAGGRKRYGRLVLLPQDPRSRTGVQIQLEADASSAIANPTVVGQIGALKTALRSFRFGTDPP